MVLLQQNEDGKLWGFEFEARKNLGFIAPTLPEKMTFMTPVLQRTNFLTNVTFVQSEVTALVRPATALTPASFRTRDLQGQSPYVVNAAVEYVDYDWGTVRLLYNTVGPTITAVQDRTGLPDFIQERRDQLDFVYLTQVTPWNVPLTVKFAVENILNDSYPTFVGDTLQEDYRTGVNVSLGISYSY